jgi:RES domain-containing protein
VIVTNARQVSINEISFRADSVERLDALLNLVVSADDQRDLEEIIGSPEPDLSVIANLRFASRADGYYPQRYNTTSFAAFYVARDERTATAEKLHYTTAEAVKLALSVQQPIFLEITEWQIVAAIAEDITLVDDPRLMSPADYEYCQKVAADVRTRSSALVYLSVRNPGGQNIAVFERTCVNHQPRTNRTIQVGLDTSGHPVIV